MGYSGLPVFSCCSIICSLLTRTSYPSIFIAWIWLRRADARQRKTSNVASMWSLAHRTSRNEELHSSRGSELPGTARGRPATCVHFEFTSSWIFFQDLDLLAAGWLPRWVSQVPPSARFGYILFVPDRSVHCVKPSKFVPTFSCCHLLRSTLGPR